MEIKVKNTRVFVDEQEIKGWRRLAILLTSIPFVLLVWIVCALVLVLLTALVLPAGLILSLILGIIAVCGIAKKKY